MPLNIDVTQILLHALNLVILIGGLALILYRPVARFLKQRRDTIAETERNAAESAAEGARLKEEYENKLKDADEYVAQRRREAEREISESAGRYMDNAKAKAEAIVKAAEEEAEARKEHILESAQTEIGELVISATQKLMKNTSSAEGDLALYDEFIKTAEKEDASRGGDGDE